MVPGAGIEPAWSFLRGILSPLRLPISPPGHYKVGDGLTIIRSTLSMQCQGTAVYHNATRAILHHKLEVNPESNSICNIQFF